MKILKAKCITTKVHGTQKIASSIIQGENNNNKVIKAVKFENLTSTTFPFPALVVPKLRGQQEFSPAFDLRFCTTNCFSLVHSAITTFKSILKDIFFLLSYMVQKMYWQKQWLGVKVLKHPQ
jgi:hypothetical protein